MPLLAEVWSVESLLIAAVVALAGVVTKLWLLAQSHHQECLKDKDELEDKIDHLWETLLSQNRATCSVTDCSLRKVLPVPTSATVAKGT